MVASTQARGGQVARVPALLTQETCGPKASFQQCRKMKPPVSSSRCANEQEVCKAPANQRSFAGEPNGTCAKPAATCQTQWNGQANTACEGGAMQVDDSEPRQNGQAGTSPPEWY
ncbi:hypothetical protein MTO96_013356 [Rhipicephalus appendiculatus]